MAETATLAVSARPGTGKGAARASRRNGQVPGVIYGEKKAPISIEVEARVFEKAFHGVGFFTTLFDLDLDGKKHKVLARDVQLHPVTDRPLHVDFLRVSAKTEIAVEVPVHFLNEESCPGIRRGGVLSIVRHEVEIYCRADAIPNEIEIDLSPFEIGDSIHISAAKLPDGVRPTIEDRDFTVATIAAPTVVADEAAEEAAEDAEAEADGEETAEDSEEAEAEQ